MPDGVRSVRLYYYGEDNEPAYEAGNPVEKAIVEQWLARYGETHQSARQIALEAGEAALREKQWSLSVHYWGGREWSATWSRPDAIAVKRATGETEYVARSLALHYAQNGLQ